MAAELIRARLRALFRPIDGGDPLDPKSEKVRATEPSHLKLRASFSYLFALAVTVIVYGAIPFLSIPTMGQTIWVSGFAQSFLNAGWPAIQAINFGIPGAMPIPFGLAGAFLQSTLIALFQLHPSDAYSFGAVIWLAIALAGCSGFARFLGANRAQAPFYSLMYLTLPMVWWHASYSMLSFGFALLPLYLLTAFKLVYALEENERSLQQVLRPAVLFIMAALLAAFMDGYTYVMFACSTAIIYLVVLFRGDLARLRQLILVGPLLSLGLFLSSYAYLLYIGKPSFRHMPMDFFRGWGVDISMILIPSREVSWLCDVLHLSTPRGQEKYFGDNSVWMTTFSAPFLVVAAIGFPFVRKYRHTLTLLLIVLTGFYFSLGPSLKINSVRPPNARFDSETAALMPEQFALGATGNGFFYEKMPGIKSMRSTYRWLALMFIGLFGLIVLWLKDLQGKRWEHIRYAIPSFLVLFNLPNLADRLSSAMTFRHEFNQLDRALKPLNDAIGSGRRALFYPQGNDFMVNYLAAKGNYFSYNVGGDKNTDLAAESWFTSVRNFFSMPIEEFNEQGEQHIAEVLRSGDTDCVVLPYFDLLWNAHGWPPEGELVRNLRERYSPTVSRLAREPDFMVRSEVLFAVISLSRSAERNEGISVSRRERINFGVGEPGLKYLSEGWSKPEEWGTWAGGETGILRMKVKDDFYHDLNLKFEAKALVSKAHPLQTVYCYVNRKLLKFAKFRSLSATENRLVVPKLLLRQTGGMMEIEFRARHLQTAAELGIDNDTTIRGLGLISVSID